MLFGSNHARYPLLRCVRSLNIKVRAFHNSYQCGAVTSVGENGVNAISRTRNIGIIAHIDAVGYGSWKLIFRKADIVQGKTTTTERMLYYSGHTRRIGSKSPYTDHCNAMPQICRLAMSIFSCP